MVKSISTCLMEQRGNYFLGERLRKRGSSLIHTFTHSGVLWTPTVLRHWFRGTMGDDDKLADMGPALVKHSHQRRETRVKQPLEFRMKGNRSGKIQ